MRPFPDVESGRVPVSTEGGVGPLWAHDGSHLFFVTPGGAVEAAVETVGEFRVVETATVFTLGNEYVFAVEADFYDITPDDQRFLMARVPGGCPPRA